MLHMDPDIQMQFDEPPYRPRREHLYAPAEPFVRAILDWLGRHDAQLKASPFHGIARELRKDRPTKTNWRNDRYSGIAELARRSRMDQRAIRRYIDRESPWIELDSADRLAVGLGIPLCLLADEFRPREETTRSGRPKR